MEIGTNVKAKRNHARVEQDKKGVVVVGPKTGLKEDKWVWVQFEGIVDPKLMRPDELEATYSTNYDGFLG